MENNVEGFQKLKIESPEDPAIPLLGIHLQITASRVLKRHGHTQVHSSNKVGATEGPSMAE